MKKENRKRDIQLVFRVTADERIFIQEKMRLASITSFCEYIRRMATKGYIVNVDWTEIKNFSVELQKIDVNIRQILRYVDKTGALYAADAEEIRTKMCECWDVIRAEMRDMLRLSQK